jgi:hypothetical protein
LCIPKMCQLHFSCWWLCFELLFDWQCHMSCHVMLYSGICFLECNGGSTSHPQCHFISERCHLNYDSSSVGLGRSSNNCTSAVLWVV